MNEALSTSIDIEVPFFDVDSYRIAWHGSYVKYFEVARCKLLEKIDFTYDDMEESGFFYPIVDIQIKYIKPLRFKQQFTITASIVEWEHRLKIKYLITDKKTGERVTKGHTTQAAVTMPDETMLLISPPILIDKINKALSKHE